MNTAQFARLERRFLRLVCQDRPLDEAARACLAEDPQVLPVSSWVEASSEALALARLNIYAQLYFARLRDSLRDDYESCAKLVQARTFDRLAAGYILQHPSDNPSLRYHGRHFPEFLSRGRREGGDAFAELRPDLVDLSRLEWSRIECFDAADAAALTNERLKSLGATSFEDLRFALVPAVQLLTTEYSVSALWDALAQGAQLPAAQACSERLLVWRRGFTVQHRVLEPSEARALTLVTRGANFASVCEAFADSADDVDGAGRLALATLLRWLADELLLDGIDS